MISIILKQIENLRKSKHYLLKLIHKLNSNKQCKTYTTHNFIYINVYINNLKNITDHNLDVKKVYLLKRRFN